MSEIHYRGFGAIVLFILAAFVAAPAASAAPFANGSFENPALATDGTANINTLTDWSFSGSGLLLERDANPSSFSLVDGDQFVSLGQDDTVNSRLYQDFDTIIGQAYEVSYVFSTQDGLGGSQELTVSVFADGQFSSPLASQSDIVASGLFFAGAWIFPLPLEFTATTTTTRLEFRDTVGDTTANIGIDAVQVTPVPEPGSAALLALGGVAIFRRTRQKRCQDDLY